MSKVAKVPVILQMEALECGAASLSMILAYYGKWIPSEMVRSACGVSRDGSNAMNILKAARNYGLDATGYRMEPDQLRDITFPAIIHWKFNHFVVLTGFTKKRAIINDPAKGTVYVDNEEFDKSFTGIVLTFSKTDAFVPEGKARSAWGFATSRLKGYGSSLAFVMVVSALVALSGLVMPLFSKIFIDDILTSHNEQWLSGFIATMSLAVIFQFTTSIVRSVNWLRLSGRFAITANAKFMWHVLRMPMEFFSQRWAGDISNRQQSNEKIASTLMEKTAPALVNIVFLCLYIFVMISYNLPLTVVCVLTVILNVVAVKYRSGKMINLARRAQSGRGKLMGATTSGIEMIETIKASGSEGGFFARWSGYFARQHNANVEITRFSTYFDAITSLLNQFASIAILMLGAFLILDGRISIGVLLAFQGFLTSLMAPVGELVTAVASLTDTKADMERVDDVLNYRLDEEGVSSSGTTSGKLTGAIEIKNLTFGYSKLAEPLVKDFSISIKPGSCVAFVGGSGCGKSTLAKLITGLYHPWEGEIRFDGLKREQIDEYSFRSSVTMVDQEITLFEDTVANNIRMWDNSIEDFAVIMAARDADIHDTIVTRNNGYDHVVKEGGRNLSGGQRQRLEIARVLSVEPTIIVLDEATSALDAKTEEKVMSSIRNLGATCIIIAHRLSTIRDCDEILVLDKGEVLERGTHDELLAKGGKYAQLITTE